MQNFFNEKKEELPFMNHRQWQAPVAFWSQPAGSSLARIATKRQRCAGWSGSQGPKRRRPGGSNVCLAMETSAPCRTRAYEGRTDQIAGLILFDPFSGEPAKGAEP